MVSHGPRCEVSVSANCSARLAVTWADLQMTGTDMRS